MADEPDEHLLERLTPREREILRLVAVGLSNPEIAVRMHLSVHTVKYHLSHIFQKLGVANRTEAAVIYSSAQRQDGEQ